ncbi:MULTISPECIES: hypothetical protein [Bacillus]|uniref:hypothetical protein n=1 Tax=Bacillus TaxID=1386 RepID=UPI0002E57F87|nr:MULTISPECIES: hypothetical protein [Bacillus]
MDQKCILIVAMLCLLPVFPIASAIGIFGMTFVFSVLGNDLFQIIVNPLKIIVIAVVMISISILGKFVEQRFALNN